MCFLFSKIINSKNNLVPKTSKILLLFWIHSCQERLPADARVPSPIYDKTGYYRYVSARLAGRDGAGNLDMLVEKAAAYEATSYRGVLHFIRYIEN